MGESTVAATLFIDVAGYLERLGFSSVSICRSRNIDPAVLQQPNCRVPGSWMEALWEEGERLTGDRDLGLHTAEAYNPGALNILGYVLCSCRSAGEALNRLAQYVRLLNDGLRVQIVTNGEMTICTCEAIESLDNYAVRSPRQVMEAMACGITTTLKRLSATPISPVSISFQHEQPASITEHLRLLGPDLQFGERADEIVFRSVDLASGLLSANADLLAIFESRAQSALAQLGRREALSYRIATILAERIRGTVPALAELAAELAMSERSVQRELRAEATTYRKLVEAVRRQLALLYLKEPGTSASEVGFLLGFSEPSAFTRAFRRWTGSPPTLFRSRKTLL